MSEPLVGVVVAAGYSTRMGGFPKPLLWFDGQRFVERLVGTYAAAGVEPVVVLGYEADEVRARADLSDATVLVNEDFDDGMLSSVQTAVRHARERDAGGLFLSPVDFPLVTPDAIDRLRSAFDGPAAHADVVHPTVDGERGHPPLFAASTFDALLTAPIDEGARAVVYDPETVTVDVAVDDRRLLTDIDTPAEYWAAVRDYEPARTGP